MRLPYTKEPKEGNLIELRFTRVAFGIISSPFLLNATIQFHLNHIGDETCQLIIKNIYVDNALVGAKDEKKAIELYRKVKISLGVPQ